RLILAVVMLAFAPTALLAQSVDRAKLRKALYLPQVYDEIKFAEFGTYNPDGKRYKAAAPGEIARLLKEMKGDLSDAERYYDLADWLWKNGQKDEGDRTNDKALELLGQRHKQEPKNGHVATLYGRALVITKRKAEAGAWIEAGARLSPEDHRCWIALGQ